MQLTRGSLEATGGKRLAIGAACVLVALAACTSALALRMDVNQPPSQNTAAKKVEVKADALTILYKAPPVYPVEAKKAKVSGAVKLAAVIGKEGTVENLRVVSGPAPLQQSALDAVKQWRYQPFLLNGDPIEVETTINIVYSLRK